MAKKDIYILGLNTSHNSSACLLKNGKICVAIAEERLNRVKNSLICDRGGRFFTLLPHQAIQYCLDCEGIDINHLTLIVASAGTVYHPQMPYANLNKAMVAAQLPHLKDRGKIFICNHHLSHAASAFWCSPFKEAAILIADCGGNMLKNKRIEHTSIFIGKNNNIQLLKRITSNERGHNSLGEMYTLATLFMGFGVFNEGKTMGLAPYGNAGRIKDYAQAVRYTGSGNYTINPHFQFVEDKIISDKYKQIFGQPRTNGSRLRKIDKDIAYAVQKRLEDILIHLCNYAYQLTGCDNLCLAGGVGLNCTANGKIMEQTPFKHIFIQPAAADDGCALGNALYGWHSLLKKESRFIMKNTYLGKDYAEEKIKSALTQWKDWSRAQKTQNIAKQTAQLLARGKIIGWFQGGAEFGPRALGHRSILADPRNPKMKTLLNEKVKHREAFRPYAPSVLKEKAVEYFYINKESPFMLLAIKVKQKANIPAVVHIDDTARIQTVTKEENGIFYNLINEFYNLTGIPMVLNTSFNKENEPIVETPYDAIQCFLRTEMDYLVIGNYIVTRAKDKKSLLFIINIFYIPIKYFA